MKIKIIIKLYYLMLIAIVSFSSPLFAQPYLYNEVSLADTASEFTLTNIMRVNLFSGKAEIFLKNILIHEYNELRVDAGQNWVSMGYERHYYNYFKLYNCSDTSNVIQLSEDIHPYHILYSRIKNKIYLNGVKGDSAAIVTIDPIIKGEVVSYLPLADVTDPHLEAFFSSDENRIYFSQEEFPDATGDKTKILYYSVQNNNIARIRPISEVGFHNSDAYDLCRGRNGKGIVKSIIYNSTKDRYFNIYDFDRDISSNFILFHGYAEPFILGDGKYLALVELEDKTIGIKGHPCNSGTVYIYDMQSTRLVYTFKFPEANGILFFDSYPDYIFPLGSPKPINVDSLVKSLSGIKTKLVNSTGSKLTGGSLQYYEGAWKDAVNNNDGTFTVPTTLKTISLRMTYAYGTQTKNNVTVSADTVVFQTVNTKVQLQSSQGTPLDTGKVQYYAGAWRDFGSTANGTTSKELLPGSYSFRMTYGSASNDKTQDIGVNANVIFQTVNANVKLQNSSGNPIDQGTVQYYSGAWRDLGTTSNGIASKELLPNNYSFRMTYAYASNDKQQNIGTDPNVIFKTVNANVQLQNSSGNLMDQGIVQYYSGAWRDLGTTSNGIASKELLPNNYSFRMTYAYASNDKQQNVGTDPNVIFKTVNTQAQLQNSQGAPLDTGKVQYYSGAWRDFGTTSNGITSKELLPNTYSFRMTHAFISKDVSQNTAANNIVKFSTVLATIRVRDAQNNPVNNASASYYSGAWRQIGLTTNGTVTKELLPANLTFRVNYNSIQKDKTQDTSVNNIIEFIY